MCLCWFVWCSSLIGGHTVVRDIKLNNKTQVIYDSPFDELSINKLWNLYWLFFPPQSANLWVMKKIWNCLENATTQMVMGTITKVRGKLMKFSPFSKSGRILANTFLMSNGQSSNALSLEWEVKWKFRMKRAVALAGCVLAFILQLIVCFDR